MPVDPLDKLPVGHIIRDLGDITEPDPGSVDPESFDLLPVSIFRNRTDADLPPAILHIAA